MIKFQIQILIPAISPFSLQTVRISALSMICGLIRWSNGKYHVSHFIKYPVNMRAQLLQYTLLFSMINIFLKI